MVARCTINGVDTLFDEKTKQWLSPVSKMKIGIIGLGMVGEASYSYLSTIHKDIKRYDPAKKHEDSLAECTHILICVPAPTKSNGEQDYSIIEESIDRCPIGSIIFIRSTVLPDFCKGRNIVFMPEFLTERTRHEDVKNLPIIFGGSEKPNHKEIFDSVKKIFPHHELEQMTNAEVSLAKYAHNCFSAVKVNFWNNISMVCELGKANYDNVLFGAMTTGFINKQHTQVPGHDGKFGYGGACLPKDLAAFSAVHPYMTLTDTITENAVNRLLIKHLPSEEC